MVEQLIIVCMYSQVETVVIVQLMTQSLSLLHTWQAGVYRCC